MKVLFIASEVAPFAKVGGLGDVIGSLPKALKRLGVDVRIAVPYYDVIKDKKNSAEEIFIGKKISIEDKNFTIGLYETRLPKSSVQLYLIDNKKYFGGGGIYYSKTAIAKHKSEMERFWFFSDVVNVLLRENLLPFKPEIIHGHDWHASHLIKKLRVQNSRLKTILTIHNLGNQGVWDKTNTLKEGIESADIITTVSPTYAKEIQTDEYGADIEQTLRRRAPIKGIVNGFEYGTLTKFKNKSEQKKSLQRKMGLQISNSRPLFSLVARLTNQKGIRLITPALKKAIKDYGAQFIFLGTGEKKYEAELKILAKSFPKDVSSNIMFNEKLAHEIYAGSDFFLMPSIFEPCGLGQMIAMHYGTIPVVRDTGGLHDTVRDKITGFKFKIKSSSVLLRTIGRACRAFENNKKMNAMIKSALAEDWSWKKSAKEYLKLYRNLLKTPLRGRKRNNV